VVGLQALLALCGSLVCAIGTQWGRNQLAINTLYGGLGVALGGFALLLCVPHTLIADLRGALCSRLALTNLDERTLADITGLNANQVEYLIHKKAMEDGAYIPQEATNSTPWWFAPYSQRLYMSFMLKPEDDLPSTVDDPLERERWRELNDQIQTIRLQSQHDVNKQVREMETRAVQQMHEQLMREIRSFSPGPLVPAKR
jgi:hypothetical protein